jgi:hypothetical protein
MKKIMAMSLGVALVAGSVSVARADDDGGRFPFLLQGMQTGGATTGLSDGKMSSERVSERHARGQNLEKHGNALGFESGARGSVRDIIARHAAANGVPFALADAVVRIESRYNPRVSNGGAFGLMQIKPATARGVGFAGSASALYNAETNVAFGMRYLAQAYRMSGGDTCATVMRYQSGHYASHMNAANRSYCSKARAIMASR